MASMQHLRYTATIHAPAATVWDLMLEHGSYERWTAAFHPGSTYEGSWEQGAKIRFLGPEGGGMVSEIAQNRRHEFLSIRHLGFVADGVEDTTSEAVRAWAPAYENYTFTTVPGGTQLLVEMDVPVEWQEHMDAAWPQALARLKELSESGRSR